MADGGRLQEMRHVAIVDRRFGVDLVRHGAQPGPQDDPGPRLAAPPAADKRGGLVDLAGNMQHGDLVFFFDRITGFGRINRMEKGELISIQI
jgi:hypothetical protein